MFSRCLLLCLPQDIETIAPSLYSSYYWTCGKKEVWPEVLGREIVFKSFLPSTQVWMHSSFQKEETRTQYFRKNKQSRDKPWPRTLISSSPVLHSWLLWHFWWDAEVVPKEAEELTVKACLTTNLNVFLFTGLLQHYPNRISLLWCWQCLGNRVEP